MSISFYAGKYESANQIGWVFTSEEITSTFYKDDDDMEGTPNPAYRPELDMNTSTYNACAILNALNILSDEGCFRIGIDEMIERCTAYLKTHVDKKSPEVEFSITKGDTGPTMIDCGRPEGYIERQVHRLAVLAREGKSRGAEVIYGC